ncbi:TetR/AcrR family transcriptional regulator C-terminal domain-containing protein [Psychromicrobium sp. YIM B11713]|uniref:TetR/AcrR family transcriptional regulator C-terminal domain-containing protein n=1 Tax=Psychromicrobium sp. YIM B11713 TaxID=3145233 RepID=UPI00374F3740
MPQVNTSTKRGAGRPALISRASIGEAALAELEGISSTKVAKRLGVAQSSLYRHITDRADLIRLAVDYALDSHEWPPPHDDWRQYLTEYAISFWKLLEKHPGLSDALRMLQPTSQRVIDVLSKVAIDLLSSGFTAEEANMAVDMLSHVTINAMISEQVFNSPGRRGTTVRQEARDAWLTQDQRLAEHTRQTLEQSMFLNLQKRVDLVLDGLEMKLLRRAQQ